MATLTDEQKLARIDDKRALLVSEMRKKDARKKITLGGLVIIAGMENWNEAEIVGALLFTSTAGENKRAEWRETGIAVMEAREAARKKKS